MQPKLALAEPPFHRRMGRQMLDLDDDVALRQALELPLFRHPRGAAEHAPRAVAVGQPAPDRGYRSQLSGIQAPVPAEGDALELQDAALEKIDHRACFSAARPADRFPPAARSGWR